MVDIEVDIGLGVEIDIGGGLEAEIGGGVEVEIGGGEEVVAEEVVGEEERIVLEIPEEEEEEIRFVQIDVKKREVEQCFHMYDLQGNGSIPNEKVATLMRALGANVNEDGLPAIYKEIDPENSGSFGVEIFLTFMESKVQAAPTKKELSDAFMLFDRNGDGVLDISDMVGCAAFLGITMTKDELKFMFDKADSNNDGIITFDDFCMLLG